MRLIPICEHGLSRNVSPLTEYDRNLSQLRNPGLAPSAITTVFKESTSGALSLSSLGVVHAGCLGVRGP
jgi:hypothetical protein